MSSDVIDDDLNADEKFDDDTSLLDGLLDGKYPDSKKESKSEKSKADEEEQEDDKPKAKEYKRQEEKVAVQEKEEQEEEKEEEEPEDTGNRNIDLKKIKEKYPEFAKTREFNELRNAYYREGKYTELFPTVEDAQEAAENNEMFNKMNADLLGNGDVTNLLSAIKDANPQQLRKVATGFMDTLSKVDTPVWQEAMGVMIKRIARDLDANGKKFLARNQNSDDGKALVATARNILLHYFDDDRVDTREQQQPQVSEREKELEAREQQIAQHQYTTAYQTVESSTHKRLDEMIMNGLDPNETLSDFTRNALLKEIRQEIMDQISADDNHVKKMTSLWNRAVQSGFDRASLSRIASAYLERARPIIPSVRNKFRSMAIKGNGHSRDRSESPSIPNRGRTGRPPSNDGKVNVRAVDSRKIDYHNTTDDDIFEGRAKLKSQK